MYASSNREMRKLALAQLPSAVAVVVTSSGRVGFATTASLRSKVVDVPLVFVPGMKGTHLAYNDDESGKRIRPWLTLGNLLNIPPKEDFARDRALDLPLTYDYTNADKSSMAPSTSMLGLMVLEALVSDEASLPSTLHRRWRM